MYIKQLYTQVCALKIYTQKISTYKVRGEYGFMKLMKYKMKGKICFVIHIAGEKKLSFYLYFVIVKQKFINGLLITTHR